MKTLKQRLCKHLFVDPEMGSPMGLHRTGTCRVCGLVGAQEAPYTEATLRAKRRYNRKQERKFLKEHGSE
jgi:hypothetical protein